MASKDFQKIFKTRAVDCVAVAGKQAGEYKFSMQIIDLGVTKGEDGIAYPESADTDLFLKDLYSKSFAPKVLTAQALEAMAAKGITPKKAVRELAYAVVITSSVDKVHASVSIPKDWKTGENAALYEANKDLSAFLKAIMGTAAAAEGSEVSVTIETDDSGEYALGSFTAKYPFKIRDEVLTSTGNELTKRGLLTAEEDDDYIPSDGGDDDGDW